MSAPTATSHPVPEHNQHKAYRRVIVESPFAGDVETNTAYARAALHDCLARGEAPIASHLLYTQPGVLNDDVPEERVWGIEAGLAWSSVAEATVVYDDLGISRGMRYGIERAEKDGRSVEYRQLPEFMATLTAAKEAHAQPRAEALKSKQALEETLESFGAFRKGPKARR